ncbi:MAG: polyhydroxyalkanoic acid system family protein [Betaproteobacteria bacterium]|nr:polyhydroxyalkanoic acid system family protein [Betaproteobacteria bacterium]
MADISIKRKHQLGLKGARTAADKMADKLGEKFDLAGDWDGNVLVFRRTGVNGTLEISHDEMHLQVTLNFMLKMMKGPIEQAVHEQLEKVLAAPAKAKAATPAKAPAAKKPAAKKR